ncbi:hypothetical protein HK105_200114 [Polyrhizophydium stewartii]|uniref:Uncharacterized protein n=1 Tax=Polyrhizophydium stewartii TaxID=2732419 RepID=A0ABR4NKJ0_9FUNG
MGAMGPRMGPSRAPPLLPAAPALAPAAAAPANSDSDSGADPDPESAADSPDIYPDSLDDGHRDYDDDDDGDDDDDSHGGIDADSIAVPLARPSRLRDWPALWVLHAERWIANTRWSALYAWDGAIAAVLAARVVGLIAAVDPAAFFDSAPRSPSTAALAADPQPTPADTIRAAIISSLAVLQIALLLALAIAIFVGRQASPPPPSLSPSSAARAARWRRRKHGPTLSTKLLFLFGVLLTCLWWAEPSLVNRAVEARIRAAMDPAIDFEHYACVVPPWWWIDGPASNASLAISPATASDIHSAAGIHAAAAAAAAAAASAADPRVAISAHGWASWMELLEWLGILGIWLLFAAVRAEYKRNMEEWVWITVSEVQNTFDFRR